jgi:TetR/AcrR family transcriptional repressor of nem operon
VGRVAHQDVTREERMRYPADQKAKAREALLQSATKALRQSGFNGVGVDALAASAGVTSGAFYSHFSGKEALLNDVIDANLGQPFIDPDAGTAADRRERLKDFLRMYISALHRADPANGCVMPTLSADVARSSDAVRETYGRRMRELVDKIVRVIGAEARDADERAWSVVVLMVGAVSIARALPAGPEAERVLNAALHQAVAVIESSPARKSTG